ncbi:TIGR00270 family protein [Candidatus Woesearchaeota archaeon]|nr:TIGR00270 family protein [Candidatus Woesearchaeota archaeon]
MQCEICGFSGQLYKAKVESTLMNLCANCLKYGKPIEYLKENNPLSQMQHKKNTILKFKENISSDFKDEPLYIENLGKRVKQLREKLNLKQSELAQKISEKESIIHKIESDSEDPSIQVIRKLERFFKVKLIEK